MDFRERALHEARRYGDDPYVFVRELIQNARDADARAVHFHVELGAGRSRVACRDDGMGMSLDHARRYLFTLYASSKERVGRDAGRFGVGFWSVLRLEPERILVRSWPRHGPAWEIALSGDLATAVQSDAPACPFAAGHGTEVLLERAREDTELRRRVRDAAIQSARFVTRRGDPGTPLELRVDGERMNAPFALGRPSVAFRRRGIRGVVGLASEARVELFARGLRVRSAASLADLHAGSGATRVRFPETEGLVPRALLDGQDLEPLLARSDVKDDRALRRLLRLAESELCRLVDRQLALARPEARWRRAARLGLALLALAGVGLLGRGAWSARGARSVAQEEMPTKSPRSEAPRVWLEPFRDPGSAYAGPEASRDLTVLRVPLLRYAPAEERPLLAVLRMADSRLPPPAPQPDGRYEGGPCVAHCLEIELLVEGDAGPLRLPRATGHVLDAESVRVDGQPTPLLASGLGEPLIVRTTARRALVRYRSGPGREAVATERPRLTPPAPGLRAVAAALAGLAPAGRVAAAVAWVRGAVRYSTAAQVVADHRSAAEAGADVVARALRIGAGDCDVQNAVLATLLQDAGVPARLVVGHVGENGGALPALHAWVEWRDSEGRWRAADASADPSAGVPPAPLAATGRARAARSEAPDPAGVAAPRSVVPAGLGLLAVTGAGVLALAVSRRTRRRLELDPAHDVARLLQGALTRPEAFRAVPAVFERPLVPLCPRGLARLAEVWDDATRRRLYASERATALAREAARAGGRVVDVSRPEGRLVADALGAVDLDAWDALLRRGRRSAALARVERAFRGAGEPLSLRCVEGLGASAVLDLPAGRWRRGARRCVVLDAEGVGDRGGSSRGDALAAFGLAARLLTLLKLGPRRAVRVLAPLAATALRDRR